VSPAQDRGQVRGADQPVGVGVEEGVHGAEQRVVVVQDDPQAAGSLAGAYTRSLFSST
jgi:hypothetical protein